MIPPARHGGRKRSVNVREVLNGIFYVLWTGCQWKAWIFRLGPVDVRSEYKAVVHRRPRNLHISRHLHRPT
jgi:transposase